MPMEPVIWLASSERMSPKMLLVTMTSKLPGVAHQLHGGVVHVEVVQGDLG